MFLLITSLLISIVAALWVWITARKDPAGRLWLTELCIGVLLILPLLAQLPKTSLAVNVAVTSAGGGGKLFFLQWLVWLWGVGAVMMLGRLIYRHWLLHRWLRDSLPVPSVGWSDCLEGCQQKLNLKCLPEIRIKRGLRSPVVAGLIHPVILMPDVSEHWDDETRKIAFLHELGHVRRGDLWLRLAADICAALHWYNPLVNWMRAKLFSQCEYACDAWVIETGVDRRCYISALCDVVESAAGEIRPSGVLAMADHAPLKLRVDHLMRNTRLSRPWVAGIAAAVTISMALGFSMIRPANLTNDKNGLRHSSSEVTPSMGEVELRHAANPFPGN